MVRPSTGWTSAGARAGIAVGVMGVTVERSFACRVSAGGAEPVRCVFSGRWLGQNATLKAGATLPVSRMVAQVVGPRPGAIIGPEPTMSDPVDPAFLRASDLFEHQGDEVLRA